MEPESIQTIMWVATIVYLGVWIQALDLDTPKHIVYIVFGEWILMILLTSIYSLATTL